MLQSLQNEKTPVKHVWKPRWNLQRLREEQLGSTQRLLQGCLRRGLGRENWDLRASLKAGNGSRVQKRNVDGSLSTGIIIEILKRVIKTIIFYAAAKFVFGCR